MYIRVSWGKLKPGNWDQYERTYKEAMSSGDRIEGLRGRILAHDLDDPEAGYTISFWQDEESMRAHEQSPRVKAVLEQLKPYFTGEYSQRHCEVRLSDLDLTQSG